MTKEEALKMAIEYLEDNQHYVADNEAHFYVMEYNNVIEMCKIALAELEPVIDKSAATRIATALGWTPQRTWVGLTQEDIDIAFDDTQEGGGFWEFARAIEAKLKEKNT